MNEVVKLEEMCEVCHKRKATRLCDRIKAHWHWAGHQPRVWKEWQGEWYQELEKGPMSGTDTCDRKLCDKCATYVIDMDLCPMCLKELKKELGIK